MQPERGYTVQHAVDDWLAEGLDGRSAGTVTLHRHILRPVTAVIGHIEVRQLTAHDVRQALVQLARDHSTRTVTMAHNALTRALRHAEANRHVVHNVAALVDTPKGQSGRPSKALTADQAAAVLKAAKASRLGAYVILCLMTGIRTEEARALRWDQVDLDIGSIAVWRSVRHGGDTKTAKSRRTLGLPQAVIEALREHRVRQDEEKASAAGLWQDDDLVFTTTIGTPLDAANVRRYFRSVCRATGIGEDWAPRELRTSFVSLLSASGVPVEEIARLAGHSSTRTTEVIYRKELRPVLVKGAEVLRQLADGSEIADLIWEAPDDLAGEHAQVFQAAMRAYSAGDSERAQQLWQNLRAIWSHAWSANYAVLELMQGTGLTRFSPVKPQRWVVASFEHHTSPHGLPHPHVHNIVIGGLTTGV